MTCIHEVKNDFVLSDIENENAIFETLLKVSFFLTPEIHAIIHSLCISAASSVSSIDMRCLSVLFCWFSICGMLTGGYNVNKILYEFFSISLCFSLILRLSEKTGRCLHFLFYIIAFSFYALFLLMRDTFTWYGSIYSIWILCSYNGASFQISNIWSFFDMTLTATIHIHYARLTKPGKARTISILIISLEKLFRNRKKGCPMS